MSDVVLVALIGGQNKNGVVVRLNGDTQYKLEIINQDDLTGLSKLAHVFQGHVVQ